MSDQPSSDWPPERLHMVLDYERDRATRLQREVWALTARAESAEAQVERLTAIEGAAVALCKHYVNNDEPFAKLRKALGRRGTGFGAATQNPFDEAGIEPEQRHRSKE